MNNTGIICGIYTRVSTQQQMENDYNSLESQQEKCRAYCELKKYTVYSVYEDGGFSGGNTERPELQRMLQNIQEGKINCVVIYKMDRLSRNMPDFYKLLELFEEHGASIISVTENIDTSHSMGRLLQNMQMSFAQYEREIIADRIRDKMRLRASKGMWNGRRTPYGYKNVDKKLVIDPDTAPRVQFMFEFFAGNPSISHLREALHKNGWYNSKGNKWSKTVLDHILKNKVYIGLIKCNEKYYEGIHEPIIDKVLFQRVQNLQPNRSHSCTKSHREFILKGILRCAHCGTSLSPHHTLKKRADGTKIKFYYYRCTHSSHHDYKDCPIRSINAGLIEKKIIDYVCQLAGDNQYLDVTINDLNKDLNKSLGPLKKEESHLKKRVSKIDTEISRFIDAIGNGSLPIDRIKKAISEREETLDGLKVELFHIQERIYDSSCNKYDAKILKERLQDFKALYQRLTPQEQAEALQCMIKDIQVHPDKLVLNLFELKEIKNVSTGLQKRSIWWS